MSRKADRNRANRWARKRASEYDKPLLSATGYGCGWTDGGYIKLAALFACDDGEERGGKQESEGRDEPQS